MTDEWILRVQGKEYGPVEVDTLREWKMEGRLLPANEARRTDVQRWTTAADIPGLFESVDTAAAPAAGLSPRRAPLQPRRRFGQIPIDTFRSYRQGFLQFVGLVLTIARAYLCAQSTRYTVCC